MLTRYDDDCEEIETMLTRGGNSGEEETEDVDQRWQRLRRD